MYAVFDVTSADRAKADDVLKDDVVSRQSIAVRDANVLGLDGLNVLFFVEGSEDAVARATELFGPFARKLKGEQAEEAYRRFKAQEDDVASGVGLIFGP
jgi:hypothetical protein